MTAATARRLPAVLTIAQVADLLQLSKWEIRRQISYGHLDARQPTGPGGAYRIPLSTLTATYGITRDDIATWWKGTP